MPFELAGLIGAMFVFGQPKTNGEFTRCKKTALWLPQVPRVGELVCTWDNNFTFEVVRVLWADLMDSSPRNPGFNLVEFLQELPIEEGGWIISQPIKPFKEYYTPDGTDRRPYRESGIDSDLLALWREGGGLPDVIIFTKESPHQNGGLLF